MARVKDYVFSVERESNVEQEVVAWAENHGWIARPMQYRGRRGCRDYDFYGFGQFVMIEFKKSDGEMSIQQVKERRRLAGVGLTVHVIDTVDSGVDLLRSKI